MPEPSAFEDVRLIGGFTIIRIDLTAHPVVDVIGRRALAQTRITGRKFFITIDAGLDDVERSVTL